MAPRARYVAIIAVFRDEMWPDFSRTALEQSLAHRLASPRVTSAVDDRRPR